MAGSHSSTTTEPSSGKWDTSYEWKTVALLTLGFGLVGLDRWVIADLAGLPTSSMVPDLGLGPTTAPQAIGNMISALGIAWGVSSLFMGNLSDLFGRKRVLVPALILFSLLSGFSGIAGSVGMMILFRICMGVFEGAFCPTSFATVAEASLPRRRGFNLGLQQSAFALFGLGFGPIIAAYLLDFVSWRWVFALVGVPGLIVALFVALTIREPATIKARRAAKASGHAGDIAAAKAPKLSVAALFSHRNVPLSMLALLCSMCGIFVLSAFAPAYLAGYLHLDAKTTAFIASAIGFGGFLGQWGLSGFSDIFGRRTMAVVGFGIGAVFLWLFMQLGASSGPMVLFGVLFIASAFSFGLLSLITGPIASEAAPLGMIAGATGVIVAVGEIFGGGFAPGIGGWIAQTYGIQNVLWLALGGLVAGIVVSLFYKETAPRFAKAGAGVESALDVYEDQHPEGIAGQ